MQEEINMHLEIKQTKLAPETVDSAVINKLYDLYHNRQSGDTFDLQGYIKTGAIFRNVETELETAFQDLEIEPDNYYMTFADQEVERVLTEEGIIPQGGSITIEQAAQTVLGNSGSIYEGLFRENTVVRYFDEIKYFTKWMKQQGVSTKGLISKATNLVSVDLTNIEKVPQSFCNSNPNLMYYNGINGTPYTLSLPNLVEFIYGSDSAFRENTLLKHIVSLGSVTSIVNQTFQDCTNLEDVVLPSQCITLKKECFRDCTKLHTIKLSQVTTIGDDVFNGCSSLEYCDGPNSTQGELNLPNLTGTLGNSAFKGCVKLTSIASLGSITSIGNNTFENCSNLATINFPDTITSVGASAFTNTAWYNSQPNGPVYISKVLYKCKNVSGAVVIPNNIVTIKEGAFYDCSSLTSVTIGSGVTSIGVGESIFKGCTALSTIVVDSNNAKYDSGNGSNAIIETAINTLVAGCKGTSIPNSVTKIANRAFGNNKGITSINLNNVSEIGDYAFAGDSNLITVSQGNLTKLTEGAFNGCSNLQTIDISNVTTFGYGVFYNCSALNNVTLSSSLSKIPSSLFNGCSSLTSITIPNSVTSIGSSAFSGCHMNSITLNEGLLDIGQYAFGGNDIVSITIPASVQTLSGSFGCLDRCSQLQSVIFLGTTPPVINQVALLYGVPNTCKIYVPDGCEDAYKDALRVKNADLVDRVTPMSELPTT